MGDFSAPSFSLGLDLDFADVPTDAEEEEGEPREQGEATLPTFDLLRDAEFEEEELDPRETLDPDPAPDEEPPRALKRLRRGPPPPIPPCPRPRWPPAQSTPAVGCGRDEGGGRGDLEATPLSNLDDDIEEFSSQEEHQQCQDGFPSVQIHSNCSSSKFLLHNHGVLTSQSACKLKKAKFSQTSNSSSSAVLENGINKKMFPRLTISPLRKMHILDSDSDDPSSGEDECKLSKQVPAAQKKGQVAPTVRSEEKNTTSQSRKPQDVSFWNDFSPEKKTNLATPALDEFCEEYFRSDPKVGEQREGNMSFCSSRIFDPDDFIDDFETYSQHNNINSRPKPKCNLPNPQPPAYQYFYHKDARIQRLVRERLPYFVPLGAEDQGGCDYSAADNIDYTSQFGPRDGSAQARRTCEKGSSRSSKRGKKPRTSDVIEGSHANGTWVNSRRNANLPKDAGKTRVHAPGHQSGHWFTGRDGRKVYITKNGQELTGQIAFRQYRKESGAGFRKSRKKASANKKKKR